MKVCLYLELEEKLKASGLASAINHQRRAMQISGIEYTSDPKEDFDILHLNLIGLKSLHLARKMKRKGKKVIIHAHVTAEDFRGSYRFSDTVSPFLKKYLRSFYGLADVILCPSEYTKGVLLEYGLENPIIPVSNGVDIGKFKFSEERRERFRSENRFEGIVPLCVGHMFMRKGIETFSNVASQFSNRFIWVGRRYKSVEEPRVSKVIDEAPGNVSFMNYIPEILDASSGSDILFFPSFCENQGIVVLEAAACKMPIIVRDIPVYETLTDGVNCLKAKDDVEFKDKLALLMGDEPLRKKISENAHRLSKEHSLEKVGEKLKEVYSDLLKS